MCKGGYCVTVAVISQVECKYLRVVTAVFLSYSVPAEGVVVEAWVLHQCYPFLPARGHIGAIVLIQILPKEGWVRNRWAIWSFLSSMHLWKHLFKYTLRLIGQTVCIHLSCSQSCWDVQRRCAARGGPATRVRSSFHCWCRCGGCAHTSLSGWRSGTDSTWVWWRKRWRNACRPSPWCVEFCSWPALNLGEREKGEVALRHEGERRFKVQGLKWKGT